MDKDSLSVRKYPNEITRSQYDGRNLIVNLAKLKSSLYETSRYGSISKSNTLANRFYNRDLPANTNFPDASIREKTVCTGITTSRKFKLSEADSALKAQDQSELNTSRTRKGTEIRVSVSLVPNKPGTQKKISDQKLSKTIDNRKLFD